MANVVNVRESKWTKDGEEVTTYYVSLEGHNGDVPCYDARAKELETGKPLPEGWEIATSKAGKPYLKVPRKSGGGGFGGGAAAHRNTKEGQAFEQERMDRRTALMQAVALHASKGIAAHEVLTYSHDFYAWLRSTADQVVQTTHSGRAAAAGGVSTPPAETPASTSSGSAKGMGAGTDGGEQGAVGVGEGASAPCSHHDTSPLRLDGGALPKGFLRCIGCDSISDKQGVFRA